MSKAGSFGKAVRKRRGERSLRDVAAEIGIHSATISRVERGGQPSLKTWLALLRWMGQDPTAYFRTVLGGRGDEKRKHEREK